MKVALAVVLVAASLSTSRQAPSSPGNLARADASVREAFAFLYALPSDTAGAAMGSWVVDSAATTSSPDPSGRWRLVVTRLADTGQSLNVHEMVGEPGTSPAQLAAAMAAMQRLEGKISKADAESSIEIMVTLGDPAIVLPAVSNDARRSAPTIPGAQLSERVYGHWMRVDDRELDTTYERWVPGSLLVRFGGSLTVTARGNDEMIDRVVKEARWPALTALLK